MKLTSKCYTKLKAVTMGILIFAKQLHLLGKKIHILVRIDVSKNIYTNTKMLYH